MKGKNSFNLVLDLSILIGFFIITATGVLLWQVLPHGYQSGSTVFWGLTRDTWVDVHNWVSLATLTAMAVHIVIHWKWIKAVGGRFFGRLARQARLNFSLNSMLFAGFFLANLSGLAIWLIVPGGGFQGGRNPHYGATWFGLDHHTWGDIHLWAGLAMMAIATWHIVLHWNWLTVTSKRFLSRLRPAEGAPIQTKA